MNKRQMRREFRAFLGHHYTLCGLDVIARIRIRQFLEALREARKNHRATDEQIEAVREQLLSKHMKGVTKARVGWDASQEIDTYVWGPIELFLCSAQAMIERYEQLKASHPELAFPDLDDYIKDNQRVFDDVSNLRDWVTHPGYRGNAHEALVQIAHQYDKSGGMVFYGIVRALLDLYRQFLERFNEHVK